MRDELQIATVIY